MTTTIARTQPRVAVAVEVGMVTRVAVAVEVGMVTLTQPRVAVAVEVGMVTLGTCSSGSRGGYGGSCSSGSY